MTVLGSAWLWLLVPYVALVVLVVRSYRPKVGVPFLDLWPRELSPRRRNHGLRIPPLALWLMLLAILAGIVAMARPAWSGKSAKVNRVSIVVDRGIVMLAANRLDRARERVLRELPALLTPDATIDVIDDQGRRRLSGPGGLADALAGKAEPRDTHDAVETIVRRLVNESDDPIVLMSEPVAGLPAGRVGVATPPGRVRNVGIVAANAVGGRVLLGVRNDSDERQVRCDMRDGDGGHQQRMLDLPGRGGVMEYTLECPAGRPLMIRLEMADDLAVDNVLQISPEASVKLAISAGVSATVGRFAERYQIARPAHDGAVVVHVLASQDGDIPPRAAVVIPGEVPAELGDTRVLPQHRLIANVKLPRKVLISRQTPPALGDATWRILLEANGRPVLASDDVHRRVWIGFESAEWAKETDYPIFWNNVMEFLGAADPVAINAPSPALMSITGPEQALVMPPAALGNVNLAAYFWCAASVLVLGAMVGVAVRGIIDR